MGIQSINTISNWASINEILAADCARINDIGVSTSSSSSSTSSFVFTPTGTPFARYDASQLTLNDDDLVNSFTDLSGNNYHLVTGLAPTFKTNIQNGLPVVRFANKWLTVDWPDMTQPNTYFIVFKLADTGVGGVFDGISELQRNMLQIDGLSFKLYAGALGVQGPLADTDPHVMVCRFNSTSGWLRVDGVEVDTGDVGSQINSGMRMAVKWDTGVASRINVDIMEMIVYDGSEDPTSNETGLQTKWGI